MQTTRTINPEELRNRFKAARRMPQLLEAREAVRLSLRQVSDAMDEGDGGGDGELQGLWSQLTGLLDEIGSRITRTAQLDDLERRAEGQPLGSSDRQWDRARTEFRLMRAIAGACGPQIIGTDVDWGREREVSAEIARRSGRKASGFYVPMEALYLSTRDAPPHLLRQLEKRVVSTTLPAGGPGSALIATDWDFTQFIDPLRANLAVRQLGARVISNLTANLNLPKMTTPASSAWFAENTVITTSDEAFTDVLLRPRHCGTILEFSRNMIQQAVGAPDIESIARADLAAVLARRVDLAAVSGAGTTVEPLGIVTDGAVASLTAGAPTYDGLVDLTSLLATKNALEGSLGWLADATVRGALLKLKDTMARPYGLDLLFENYPYAFTNLAGGVAAAPNPIIFANFNDLVIGMWSDGLDILVNPYDSVAYSKGGVLIRGAMTIDIQKRHVESFAYLATGGTIPTAAEVPTEGPAAHAAPAPAADARRK